MSITAEDKWQLVSSLDIVYQELRPATAEGHIINEEEEQQLPEEERSVPADWAVVVIEDTIKVTDAPRIIKEQLWTAINELNDISAGTKVGAVSC